MADPKKVGIFILLPAPLNPIGAFDAEVFKANFRAQLASSSKAKFVAVDLSGIDFVYSDAYNAFMQFHQELLKRKGTFAVIANKESLSKSLKKVGLERFIRIFKNEAEMAAYSPVDISKVKIPTVPPVRSVKKVPMVRKAVSPIAPVAPVASKSRYKPVAAPTTPQLVESRLLEVESRLLEVESRLLDKNPLEDDTPSSKSPLVIIIVLLLIAAAVVSYLVLK
jgi:anti-anti-sigma regulatory factor